MILTRLIILILLTVFIAGESYGQSFKQHRTLLKVGRQPSAIAAADLTGDGLVEILTADRGELRSPQTERPGNNEISLHIAEGDMKFRYLEPLQTGFAPYGIALANIDARKALDIVAVSFMDNRQSEPQRDVSLFLNLGESLFEPNVFTVPDDGLTYHRMRDAEGQPLFTTPGLTSVEVADLNGDGLRDLVTTSWSSDQLIVFPGEAEAYFSEPIAIPLAGAPRHLALGDFNRDGKTDCAVVLYERHQVAVLLGDGVLGFTPADTFSSRGHYPQTIRTTDINGDGNADLAVAHCDADDSIVLFLGTGDGQFPTSQEIALGESREELEEEIRDIIVEDLDGDGDSDIAAACWASGRVTLLWNDGAAGEMPFTYRREDIKMKAGRPRALCAADFNGDEKKDLAVALWEENAVALLIAE